MVVCIEVEDLLRRLTPQVLGAVVRRYGHFDLGEDATQEALVAAATQWPRDGLPHNPRAWLITVASRRLTDLLRAEQARRRREETLAQWALTEVGARQVDERDASALPRGPTGPYQLQAAIAAVHDEAGSAEATDWAQIAALYGVLLRVDDNPVVALNHAVAVGMVSGASAGLELLHRLEADPRMTGNRRFHAVRAHLLERDGNRPHGRWRAPGCSSDRPAGRPRSGRRARRGCSAPRPVRAAGRGRGTAAGPARGWLRRPGSRRSVAAALRARCGSRPACSGRRGQGSDPGLAASWLRRPGSRRLAAARQPDG